MTRLFWLTFWWLVVTTSAHAADLRLNLDGTLAEPIPVLIVDSSGTAFTGQTLSTVDLYYACGTTSYAVNETGDTLTELSAGLRPGEYAWTSNDAVGTNCPGPKVLTISGGGTDRDVVTTLFGLADNFAGTAVIPGECTASGTVFDTSLPATFTATDAAKRIFLTWTSGALKHQTAMISAFNINGCVTVSGGYTAAPANADAFILVNK